MSKKNERALRPTLEIMELIKSEKKWAAYLTDEMLPDGEGREELLRLYRWTREEARKAEEKAGTLHGLGAIFSPFQLWQAAQSLRFQYLMHRQGDKRAVLDALDICLFNSLSIPKWCSKAFVAAMYKIQYYEVKSWNDVFGKPYPKGTGARAERMKLDGLWIYKAVEARSKKGEAIGRRLFENVGIELGVERGYGCGSGTTIERTYYEWKKRLSGQT